MTEIITVQGISAMPSKNHWNTSLLKTVKTERMMLVSNHTSLTNTDLFSQIPFWALEYFLTHQEAILETM